MILLITQTINGKKLSDRWSKFDGKYIYAPLFYPKGKVKVKISKKKLDEYNVVCANLKVVEYVILKSDILTVDNLDVCLAQLSIIKLEIYWEKLFNTDSQRSIISSLNLTYSSIEESIINKECQIIYSLTGFFSIYSLS